jgi:hypothetical protein
MGNNILVRLRNIKLQNMKIKEDIVKKKLINIIAKRFAGRSVELGP